MESQINVNEVRKGGKIQWVNIVAILTLTTSSVIAANYLYNNVPKWVTAGKAKYAPATQTSTTV